MEQEFEYVTLVFNLGNVADKVKPFTFKNTWKLIAQSSCIDEDNNLIVTITVDNTKK